MSPLNYAKFKSLLPYQDYEYYRDITYYYKDLFIGKARSYLQPLWSIKYTATQITDHIYISDLASAFNKSCLINDGITHILTLVLGIEPIFPQDFIYKNIPIRDTVQQDLTLYLNECCDFIQQAINSGGKVLVHCSYGISRSSSIVIAYLMQSEGLTYEEAYLRVKEKRQIMEHKYGFKTQLMQYSL